MEHEKVKCYCTISKDSRGCSKESLLNLVLVLTGSARAQEKSLQARRIWVLAVENQTLLTSHEWWTLIEPSISWICWLTRQRKFPGYMHSLPRLAGFAKILHACLQGERWGSWACLQAGNFGLLPMALHSHTPFHSGNSRWLDFVLSQNAGELPKNWVSIPSGQLPQKYMNIKEKNNMSVPALLFSPLRWIRLRSPVFLMLHLHLKRAELCPFHPGRCHLIFHIWYLPLHRASLHSAKLFSCSSLGIQRQRPCGAERCWAPLLM